MIQPLVFKDFYKCDHRRQYPKGTTFIYSNFTPRGSRIKGINSIVVFGIQYLIKEFLIKRFNDGFFNLPKEKVVAAYKRRLDTSLGVGAVPIEHIEELHDLGYLPLCIKALPEGSLCKLRVPCLTLYNTIPKFYWLTNFVETLLSATLWGMMTSATIAFEYRKLLDYYAKETSDVPDFVNWQAHDFSMRGLFGIEASCMSGAGHLLSFTGTDTIAAIDFLEEYYNANADKELIGGSVPATEHSVMCIGSKENEIETYRRLITEIYPNGIVSIVSDTWDFWNVITETLPILKNLIMSRNGKVVIRPDSSPKTPVEIICGDTEAPLGTPENKGAIQLLWEIFGGTINSKGFKQLDPHIGLIYGDSITLERCDEICKQLKQKGFASTNVVFGVGSYTYQYNTRDTFGFAMKSTYGEVNGEALPIFKDPKTDNGIKKSALGLLKVTPDGNLLENVTFKEEGEGLLETVFLNGILTKDISLAEIRSRLYLVK